MEIFTALLIIAMVVLIGNLVRLGNCTRVVLMKPLGSQERIKAYLLFFMYLVITGVFVYCGAVSLCNMWCDNTHLHTFLTFTW